MATFATIVRRHGIARTGRIGPGARSLAFAMGDPRFSLKRAFTIPKKIRGAVMNAATSALGILPGGGIITAGMKMLGSKAFPNVDPSFFGGASKPVMSTTMPSFGPVGGAPGIGPVYPRGSYAHQAALSHGRRRSMHVTNVKALRRSMRRVQGFAKLATRVMSFTKTHRMKKHKRR